MGQVEVGEASVAPQARTGVTVLDLSSGAQEEAYGRYHEYLLTAQVEFSEVMSTAVVTLAGGSLALSITFIEKVVGAGPARYVPALFAAWGLFIAAILSTLFALQRGVQVLRGDLVAFHGGPPPSQRYRKLVGYLNLAATAALSLGFLFFATFAFQNAVKEPDLMTHPETPNQGPQQPPSPGPTRPNPGPWQPRHDSFDPIPPPPPPPVRK